MTGQPASLDNALEEDSAGPLEPEPSPSAGIPDIDLAPPPDVTPIAVEPLEEAQIREAGFWRSVADLPNHPARFDPDLPPIEVPSSIPTLATPDVGDLIAGLLTDTTPAAPKPISALLVDDQPSVRPRQAATPIIIDHAALRPAVRSPRFRWLSAFHRTIADFWDGPLGWQTNPESRPLITAKVGLRLALAFALGVGALGLGISQVAGSLSIHRSYDPSLTTSIAWQRGPVPLAAVDTKIVIGDGSQMSQALQSRLIALYGSFWPAMTTAVSSGDTAALDGLLAPDLATIYDRQVTDLHGRGLTISLSGAGSFPGRIEFLSISPTISPEQVTAVITGETDLDLSDVSGHAEASAAYDEVDIVFAQAVDGWRIATLTLHPVPPDPAN